MRDWRHPLAAPLAGGLLGLLVLLVLWSLGETREIQRERTFDTLLTWSAPLRSRPQPGRLVIVDIDAESLAAFGAWPWRRDLLAKLIKATLQARPASVAFDIVLAGPDARSPAALARQLAQETGRDDLAELARALADGDQQIADTVDGEPVALSWVLDPSGTASVHKPSFFLRGNPDVAFLWKARGASGPPEAVADAALGGGTASLPGDADGVVRRVPLLVLLQDMPRPGLALEAARLAEGASGYLLSQAPRHLQFADTVLPLPPDGLLRLVPSFGSRDIRVISAAVLLRGGGDTSMIDGAITVIGGSAPELGGLRASALAPLSSSTLIQATAIRQIQSATVPLRPPFSGAGETALSLLLIATAIAMAYGLRPHMAAAGFAAVMALLFGGSVAAAARYWLVDPTLPATSGSAAFLATFIVTFAQVRQREARLRQRFEQHLSPDIVARIVQNPNTLRLHGEKRIVTVLFTDIEGFTALGQRTEPERFITLLDDYFEGVCAIIMARGGMIDKFVGDAVHAFFNMPLDLEDHATAAIEAAVAIMEWTEAYRARLRTEGSEMGRTRIGIATGEVVVGEVGIAKKLDYTAHGSAVNMAARLEALNKELKTSILIGPGTRQATKRDLRSLGKQPVRDFGEIEIFTPAETDLIR
jgi:adenylate cyclase